MNELNNNIGKFNFINTIQVIGAGAQSGSPGGVRDHGPAHGQPPQPPQGGLLSPGPRGTA